MIFHKHLLINAKVNNPIKSEDEAIEFLTELVKAIDMKIIKGPFASYVDVEGNRGLTAIVMIETSHIAFHIWDEPSPAILQFDLYTCGVLNQKAVLETIKSKFAVAQFDYVLLDRENGFVTEEHGFE
jgi:S-adenosylmethionine/arginine decarboxylase-like enzyme